MKFNVYDLGNLDKGQIVEVTLSGSAANVRLMDNSNLSAYRNRRRHRYHGGLMTRSPAQLVVPRTGRWYVTVDMSGLRGSTRSSVRVLPSPLPPIRESLASVPSLVHSPVPGEIDDAPKSYDVFVSHASEDKEAIVRPLAEAL